MISVLPCCGYKVRPRDVGPVYWNIWNARVQCHACGHVYDLHPPPLSTELTKINQKLDKIIMKQSEGTAALEVAFEQITRGIGEIQGEIAKLKSSDPDLSPAGEAAVNKMSQVAQAVDDVVQAVAVPPVDPPVDPPVEE